MNNLKQKLANQEFLEKKLRESKHSITRVVITGGACAGKTTGLSTISQKLTMMGFCVLVVPETVTILVKGGGISETARLTDESCLRF